MNDRSRFAGNRIWLMSSVSRYQYLLGRISLVAVAITVLMIALLIRVYYLFPESPTTDNAQGEISDRIYNKSTNTLDWSVFQSRDGSVSAIGGAISTRFRLAGTFFEYKPGVTGTADIRKAIIDDLRNGTQLIIREGEKIDDTTVVKIFKDHVIIRFSSGSEEQLWLTFSGVGQSLKAGTETNTLMGGGSAQLTDLDKFGGKQTGENKWLFSREQLLEYYKGLRDEPDRLVKIFDSLKPVYVEGANRISGYRLGVEGEADFFKAVGLVEGDIVKSVNSMQMTSRNRAEYFISEFISDRANAFILEVERGGKQEKLIYQVR